VVLSPTLSTAACPFGGFRHGGDRKPPFYKPDTNLVMSPNFAEFLLDTTNNGNEILAVLEDIVEVVETGGTDL
jgi:hypothetical protein